MVVDHHYDESRPGKPLWLVIPGGLMAIAAVLGAVYVAYRAYVEQTLDRAGAEHLLIALALAFVVSTFSFSYGWELYDLSGAARLTLIIVVVSVAVVAIAAVLLILIPTVLRDGNARRAGRGLLAPVLGVFRESRRMAPVEAAPVTYDSGPTGYYVAGVQRGQFDLNIDPEPAPVLAGPPPTAPPPAWMVARPVAAAAAPAVPPPPTAPGQLLPTVICPSCGASFAPVPGKAPVCPNCGAGFAAAPVSN